MHVIWKDRKPTVVFGPYKKFRDGYIGIFMLWNMYPIQNLNEIYQRKADTYFINKNYLLRLKRKALLIIKIN